MMKTKIENPEFEKIESQAQYERVVKNFEKKYTKDFKEEISQPNGDKDDSRTWFLRDVLEQKLNLHFRMELFKQANDFRIKYKRRKRIKTFEAIEIFCKEKDLKDKFQFLLQSLAEHDGILNVYGELNLGENEPQKKTANNHVQARNKTFIPKSFDELCIHPALINDFLNLLRDTDKPCINTANEFIRNKGVFVIWFNTMEKKEMFNCTFYKDIDRAKTLNINFPGLNIGGSTFRYKNTRATEQYKNLFESAISALKPQQSQQG